MGPSFQRESFPLFFVFLLALLPGSSSWAFLEARWPSQLDPHQRTHIFLAGTGYDGIGTMFELVALAEVEKIRELDPSAQVLLITDEADGEDVSMHRLQEWAPGAGVYSAGQSYSAEGTLERLKQFSSIASLSLVGHNSPTLGMGLASVDERFSPSTPGMKILAKHFTPEAVAFVLGCNSGYLIAPGFSRIWSIPVQGSLNGTNFQQLHSNGHFYADDPGDYPRGGWASHDKVSFHQSWLCPNGECLRMNPETSPYDGKWGTLSAGLGFYKWFCTGISQDQCLRGMRLGALMHVGASPLAQRLTDHPDRGEIFKFIEDFFCPRNRDSKNFERCSKGISQALVARDNSFFPFFKGHQWPAIGRVATPSWSV